jgi:hypothetical protein
MKLRFALAALTALAASPAAAQSYNPQWGPAGNVVFPPYAQEDYWRQKEYWSRQRYLRHPPVCYTRHGRPVRCRRY